LVERLVRNEEVRGSTPLGSTRVQSVISASNKAPGALTKRTRTILGGQFSLNGAAGAG
jgi:hypothetical protein